MSSKWQRIAVATAFTAATVGVLTAAGSTAQAAGQSRGEDEGQARANQKVVEAFMTDVLDGHHGDHAAQYFTADVQWHSGTVGTVAGRDNLAGLMTAVVTAIPDLNAGVQDIFAEGDKVVVRLKVSGTQRGAILGIPASNKPVQWDAVDVYRLVDGKIAEEWAAEDYTAFLNDTGTYKAPWIQ